MKFHNLPSVIFEAPLSLLAQTQALVLDEVGLVVSVLITLTGVGLHLYTARHRMTVEERVKDNKMTEAEARRQMRFYGYCAPIVTAIGAALLIVAIFELSS